MKEDVLPEIYDQVEQSFERILTSNTMSLIKIEKVMQMPKVEHNSR